MDKTYYDTHKKDIFKKNDLYKKNHLRLFNVALSKEGDAELIAKLESEPSFSRVIKQALEDHYGIHHSSGN